MSEGTFTYDVFLSHSSKDKGIIRGIVERLRKDGLKVWLDECNLGEDQRRADSFH